MTEIIHTTGKVHTVRVDGSKMVDWNSFHDEFSRVFGFPDFYGRNMNAWIDCMTNLDDEFSNFRVEVGELVMLEISDREVFQKKHADLSSALHECAAFVNGRRVAVGELPILLISVAL
ncbi:MAG: barstar family protein [Caulobacter sp.]|nr:barstar family protein [Caulobacter sp.]